MKNVKLPDKPSELLQLALNDLEAAEASGQYNIDMSYWHSPGPQGRPMRDFPGHSGDNRDVYKNSLCTVCMAGSVLAMTLELEPTTHALVKDDDVAAVNSCGERALLFDKDTTRKLNALNELRRGNLHSAFWRLGRKAPVEMPKEVPVAAYGNYVRIAGKAPNAPEFKNDMRKIITMLKEAGE